MLSFKHFVINLNENLELAASAVHAAWRQRNPKADWNAAQAAIAAHNAHMTWMG